MSFFKEKKIICLTVEFVSTEEWVTVRYDFHFNSKAPP